MKKYLSAASAAVLVGVALTGCAASTGSSNSSNGELIIYAPMEELRADWITEQAKSELDLDVQVIFGGGADLTSRLIAEKNNPQADVIVGLGEAQLNSLSEEKILSSYAPDWAEEIPEEYRSTNTDFTLYTQVPIVIAYNTAAMDAADAPKTWEDLAKPEYKDKFAFPGLTTQTGQAAVAGVLWPYVDASTGEVSDEGWDVLTNILKNGRQLAAGQSIDWNWVKSGEMPILVNWLGGVETGAADNDLSVQVVNPPDGTPYVSTGVALTPRAAENSDAKEFLDWFGSADTQIEFVKATKNDPPLNPKALDGLPEQKASVDQVTKQQIDWAVVTPNLPDWMQKIQLEIVG